MYMKPEANLRLTRRTVSHLATRTAELGLDNVADPRVGKVRWKLREVLTACLVGMAAGCKGLGEVEQLTTTLGRGSRKLLRLWCRLPDTTARDLLCKLDPHQLRKCLHASVRVARRRKQLPLELPISAVSMDGKGTSTWLFDPADAKVKYGQRQGARATVRTVTSCWVSVPGRPCLDAYPIPPATNEMGVFVEALDALLKAHPGLAELIMYDAGACGLDNASAVVDRGLHYLMCLTAGQKTLRAEAERRLARLAADKCVAHDVDTDGSEVVERRVFIAELGEQGWLDWTHLRTLVRIHVTRTHKTTGEVATEDRYYVSSLPANRLQGSQWGEVIRRRWSVENQNHNTFDTIFSEDERPWILQPQGMLNVMLVRRLCYNLLALYRAVTLRSERNRALPWKTLLRTIYSSLLLASQEAMAGVRRRVLAFG
jgi:hypothetical protein